MKIALVQRNHTVADLAGNAARIAEATRHVDAHCSERVGECRASVKTIH